MIFQHASAMATQGNLYQHKILYMLLKHVINYIITNYYMSRYQQNTRAFFFSVSPGNSSRSTSIQHQTQRYIFVYIVSLGKYLIECKCSKGGAVRAAYGPVQERTGYDRSAVPTSTVPGTTAVPYPPPLYHNAPQYQRLYHS